MSESLRPLLRRRALRAMLLVCAMGLAAAALPAVARADRGYTVRFTQNAQGDITGAGNTLLTCRDDDSRCAAASPRPGERRQTTTTTTWRCGTSTSTQISRRSTRVPRR